MTKVLLGVHCGLNHTNGVCGGSVWECVKMCAAWASLHMHTAASGCGASRCLPQTEDTLYPYHLFKKIICRYQRFLSIVCNHLPRLLSHNTTVLQKVAVSYWLQILGAPASPEDCSTYRGRYCMWVYSQAQRLQAEPHYCPISSPQAPEPPHPRPSSRSL